MWGKSQDHRRTRGSWLAPLTLEKINREDVVDSRYRRGLHLDASQLWVICPLKSNGNNILEVGYRLRHCRSNVGQLNVLGRLQ